MIRGEYVWDVYVDIFYTGDANPVKCSPQWSGKGVGVGGTPCKEVEGQTVNEVLDRRDA
jgi:hypothetical protein